MEDCGGLGRRDRQRMGQQKGGCSKDILCYCSFSSRDPSTYPIDKGISGKILHAKTTFTYGILLTWIEIRWKGVVVLAGIELFFFMSSVKKHLTSWLCFGSVLETVLITEGCFSYC